ncbi:unnamed protein product [Paramecium sonneborni]|uniref:Uncharacterized protein n=1 Tax=Paramecium sonneborni TaxID=65129 RepID=A0A8S1PU14_9CILI|nr:unnamed protein product [Paramecium sonneborni]
MKKQDQLKSIKQDSNNNLFQYERREQDYIYKISIRNSRQNAALFNPRFLLFSINQHCKIVAVCRQFLVRIYEEDRMCWTSFTFKKGLREESIWWIFIKFLGAIQE